MAKLTNKISKMERDEAAAVAPKPKKVPAKQQADRVKDDSINPAIRNPLPTSKDDKDGSGTSTTILTPNKEKTIVSTVDNGDGTFTETWSDGSVTTKGTKNSSSSSSSSGGSGGSGDNPNLVVPEGPTAETQDAFANLLNVLTQYRLEGLAKTLRKLMEKGFTAGDAYNKVKYDNSVDPDTGEAWNSAYAKRFAGNAKLVAKGKNAMTEEAYLRLEDSMSQTLFAYGRNKMLGADRQANEAKLSEWIGNNWNADDFDKLVKNVHTRVETADPQIMEQMATYYPGIDKTDLVDYFLNPKEGLASLNRKITMGEVGAAFAGQKLDSSITNIGGLVDYGVDKEAALRGASNIAEVLPDTGKLANIYGETKIKYDQATAQDEFLKDNASARRKRALLASAERGSFAGASGNMTGQRSASTAGLF